MTEKRASIGARRNPATEQAVLDAAAALMMEQGLSGLTMEAVARRARAGKATLYRWWPTRGALLMAVYARQKQIGPYPDTGTLEGDVQGILDMLFAHWSRPEGAVFRHIVAAAQSDDDVREALDRYRADRLAGLTAALARHDHGGGLNPDLAVRDMAKAVMAMAWVHLLTADLGVDTAPLARVLVRGWANPAA